VERFVGAEPLLVLPAPCAAHVRAAQEGVVPEDE
jgi:hypothetical protein